MTTRCDDDDDADGLHFVKDYGVDDDGGVGDDDVGTVEFGIVDYSIVWRNYQTEKEYRKCSVMKDGLKKTKSLLSEEK